MAFHYVVSLRGSLYGPFDSRMTADAWATDYVADHFRKETVSWEVRGLMHPGLAHPRRSGGVR